MGEDMIKDYLYLKSEKKPRAREAPGGPDPSRILERQGVDVSMIVVTISGMPRSFVMPLWRSFESLSDGFNAVRTPASTVSGGS
jgi:hypothetical protein